MFFISLFLIFSSILSAQTQLPVTSTKTAPVLPYVITDKTADRVESVYGGRYNTHYSHTTNEWTLESTAIGQFNAVIVHTDGRLELAENISSITIDYDSDGKIVFVSTITYTPTENGDNGFNVTIDDASYYDVDYVTLQNVE